MSIFKLRDYKSVEDRRTAVENNLGITLAKIGSSALDEDLASQRHCENMIGFIQIPIGVAGPLLLETKNGLSNCFIPLATTEGALIASVNRGCRAISESGGAKVIVKKIGITRAPVFFVDGIEEGNLMTDWLEKNFVEIKKIAESTSSHLRLLSVKPWLVGRSFFIRFSFDTEDAMGMNMITIAVSEIVKFIQSHTEARLVSLSGNLCVDKKSNYLNFIEGRGYSVWAEAVISNQIIAEVLKTEKTKILEVAFRKLYTAGILSGSIGANAHIANMLSAIFLATGQDIAHVSECSSGITSVEDHDKGLYFSVYLPDLVVGTVGGGTGLTTQKEALSIISGGRDNLSGEEFAGRIAGAVLAGEMSLLSSLAEQSLARAHKMLARGTK